MGPLLSRQPLPLNLGRASTPEYQCSEFIDQSILLIRIVIGKILLQSSKEIPLAILLAIQAEANERGDCLAHARIDRLGVPRHLIGDTGSQSDGIPRFDLARAIPRLLIAAPAAFDCGLGVRHMPSGCLIPMHLGNFALQEEE
jgi:hypothetical protein